MPEVNCFATLSVAPFPRPPPHNLLHHHPLARLLKMQYDFLRTVRRRGPFQQAGLNRWDVAEGKKESKKGKRK